MYNFGDAFDEINPEQALIVQLWQINKIFNPFKR